tara:strand:+ start:1707 stop:2138 length:432 start_codon:yes stop_codon:yes gene_type:complete
MSELIKFSAPESNSDSREILGTMKTVGAGCKIMMSKANRDKTEQVYKDGTKGYNRIMLKLVNKEGNELKLICSKTVSVGLRAKTISISNLREFPICAYVAKDGTEIPQIQMPEGSGFEAVGEADGKVVAYEPQVADLEDSIAF